MIVPIQPPPRGVTPAVHRAIYEAIGTLRTAEIEDPIGRKRVGEPHDYGMLNGKPILLFFQTSGYSKSGNLPQWRHLDPTSFRVVRPLDRTFSGGRDLENARHRQWDELFIRARQS
jgi:hypothetical protein